MKTLRPLSRAVVLLLFLFLGQISAQDLWHGSLTAACGQQIPFRLFLNLRTQPPQGYFLNGSEQTKIPEIYFHSDSLELIFSEYKAAMIGIWTENAWRGSFSKYRNDTTTFEFSAFPEEKPSTAKSGHSAFEGKFKVYLLSGQTCDSTMTANFWTAGDSVFGTFIAPDGDEGLFAGIRLNDTVTLSRFTGWQAGLMKIKNEKGLWKGTLTARTGPPQEFILTPLRFQKRFISGRNHDIDEESE